MTKLIDKKTLDFYAAHKEECLHVKANSEVTADFLLGYVANLMKLPVEKNFCFMAEGRKIHKSETMGKHATKILAIVED